MTTLQTPDSGVDRAFHLAVERAEALLRDRSPDAGAFRLAAALLGAGIRAPARRLLAGGSRSAVTERAMLVSSYDAWAGEPRSTRADAAPVAWAGPNPPLPATLDGLRETPSTVDGVAGLLETVVVGLWGVDPDAPAGAVTIRPALPAGWSSMALKRLRVGPCVLDVELRRRHGDLAGMVRRVAGPAIVLTLEPRPGLPGPTLVDDIELHGGRVRFEVTDAHAIVVRGHPS